MALKDLVKRHKPGERRPPMRIILYGSEGIGKTTWASRAPSPVYMGTEGGYGELTVDAFPEPKTWDQVTKDVEMLIEEDHNWQTLVIDTIDHLERLAQAEIVRTTKGAKSIESMGFGKGYIAAAELMFRFARQLDRLRESRGMHIIFLGHATMVSVQNPDGPDYKKWTLKLHEKTSLFFREWADIVLFARRDVEVHTTETGERALFSKGKATELGARLMSSLGGISYDAKRRYNLPDEMPLDFRALSAALGLTLLDRAVNVLRERKLLEEAEKKFGARSKWDGNTLREIRTWMDAQGMPAEGTTADTAAAAPAKDEPTPTTEPAREPGAEG